MSLNQGIGQKEAEQFTQIETTADEEDIHLVTDFALQVVALEGMVLLAVPNYGFNRLSSIS